MKLTRPLIVLDLEATGLDIAKDQITQLALLKLHPDGREEVWQSLFKVTCPIAPEATEVTGITAETLKDAPSFKSKAFEIMQFIGDSDLAGFNLLNFDVPLFWEEMNRNGCTWKLEGVQIIDAGNIFKKKEPRTLVAAHKFFCGFGYDEQDAHDALADTVATREVLDGQLARYADLAELDVAKLAEFSRMDDRLDLAGKIVRNKDGVAVYNFGKSKGVPVIDDPGFGNWMLRNDFSAQTKQVVSKLLNERRAA